ncbi:MAG: glycosyltransferase family 39 protein, partial [Chloroflexota bacterium]
VVLIMLLITALTVPFMNVALWTDEMATLRQVGAMPHFGPLNYVDLLANLATGNPWHAPGYFTLLYGWGHLAGWEPFILRVFSLFCGLLALAFTYSLARDYFSPEVGVYTVFTVGVGYFFMYYLRDMRPYGLLVLMMSVCLWLYERVTRANSRRRLWYTLFTLSVAGLLYTHYFTVFGLAALGLWHLIFRFRQRRYWQTLACFAIGGVMFLPWFPVLLYGAVRSTDETRIVYNFGATQLLNSVMNAFANGNAALVLILAGVAIGVREPKARFVWFWTVVSVVLVFVASRFVPALHSLRYLLFVWAGVGMLVALGIRRLRTVNVPPALILAVWLVMGVRQINNIESLHEIVFPNLRPLMTELAPGLDGHTAPVDTLIYHMPTGETSDTQHPYLLGYYTYGNPLAEYHVMPDTYATTDAFYMDAVRATIGDASRVWITYEKDRRNWRVGPVQEQLLPEMGYAMCGVTSPDDAEAYTALFMRAEKVNDQFEPYVFQAPGGEVQLYLTHHNHTDDALSAGVLWELDADVPLYTYSVGYYVRDAAGTVVAQFDVGIEAPEGCTVEAFALDAWPAGEYEVLLGVYAWETGENLPAGDEALYSISAIDVD